ncbi:REP element-mobilizing transposase RayT [Pseudomonas graminis]|nr:REP element-mobilizing transposase RayT [Pseudomonas graminis]
MSQRSADLRLGRYSGAGQIYLLTSVVNGRQPLFSNWRTGRLVVEEFRRAQQAGIAESLAWVVMPDHFHWLVVLREGTLGMLVRRVKSGSALAIMRAGHTPLRVWQKGYHDRAVRREEDLQAVARYIVANPLRAGLVKRVGDYPLWDAVWL